MRHLAHAYEAYYKNSFIQKYVLTRSLTTLQGIWQTKAKQIPVRWPPDIAAIIGLSQATLYIRKLFSISFSTSVGTSGKQGHWRNSCRERKFTQ